MKKIISIMLVLCMTIMCTAIPAVASDDITVELNGDEIYFDQPPIIQDGRTLVPMRAIFEAMGCEVEWDADDQMIDVWKDDVNIMTMWIDDSDMWTSGNNYIELDVPPQIVNDRTLVPVRAISESMGAEVDWNENQRCVIIRYNDEISDELYADDSFDDEIDDADSDDIEEITSDGDIIFF